MGKLRVIQNEKDSSKTIPQIDTSKYNSDCVLIDLKGGGLYIGNDTSKATPVLLPAAYDTSGILTTEYQEIGGVKSFLNGINIGGGYNTPNDASDARNYTISFGDDISESEPYVYLREYDDDSLEIHATNNIRLVADTDNISIESPISGNRLGGTPVSVMASEYGVSNKKITTEIIPITYQSLVNLRDNNRLIPGQKYQITDYKTTIGTYCSIDCSVANHQFDIVVTAATVNRLFSDAYLTNHTFTNSDDDFFKNAVGDDIINLNSIKVQYSLDNDIEMCDWADISTGTGVIYHMHDTVNNVECYYDYFNILFTSNNTITGYENTFSSFDVSGGVLTPGSYSSDYVFGAKNIKIIAPRLNNLVANSGGIKSILKLYKNILYSRQVIQLPIRGNSYISNVVIENSSNCIVKASDNKIISSSSCNINGINNSLYHVTDVSITGNNNIIDASCSSIDVSANNNKIAQHCTNILINSDNNIIDASCSSVKLYDTYTINRNGANKIESCCSSIYISGYCNIINSSCNDISIYSYFNTIGTYCASIKMATGGYENSIDASCTSLNIKSYGNSFGVFDSSILINTSGQHNSFGSKCSNIYVSSGSRNSFDNSCYDISLYASYTNSFCNGCNKILLHSCDNNSFGNGCKYIKLKSSDNNSFGNNCAYIKSTYSTSYSTISYSIPITNCSFGNSCGGFALYNSSSGYTIKNLSFAPGTGYYGGNTATACNYYLSCTNGYNCMYMNNHSSTAGTAISQARYLATDKIYVEQKTLTSYSAGYGTWNA